MEVGNEFGNAQEKLYPENDRKFQQIKSFITYSQ